MENKELQMLQALPLDIKIAKTKQRITEWYDYWGGQVYVSFSGGKDSTVLLHIVRELFPEVPAVFSNTGLEYPEIVSFVKTIDNVIWLKPKKSFKQVLDDHGYPVVSKEVSRFVYDLKTTKSEKMINWRLNGGRDGKCGKLSLKWRYLVQSPFKISDKCCEVMKKRPIAKYEKESGRKSFIGTMANESRLRLQKYLKHGCNAFDMKKPHSTPLGFWTEQDVLQYIKEKGLNYASVYGDIVQINGKYDTTGCKRTGCVFCAYGCHLEKEPNRFQMMKLTHPQLYDYCMNKLGMREVLEYIGVKYE